MFIERNVSYTQCKQKWRYSGCIQAEQKGHHPGQANSRSMPPNQKVKVADEQTYISINTDSAISFGVLSLYILVPLTGSLIYVYV